MTGIAQGVRMVTIALAVAIGYFMYLAGYFSSPEALVNLILALSFGAIVITINLWPTWKAYFRKALNDWKTRPPSK
jgi:hypothetical protein